MLHRTPLLSRTRATVAVAVLAIVAMCGTARAATFTASSSTPAINNADIAQLIGTTDPGGNLGHVWNNRPIHGQTFTTGNSALGFSLDAVTLKNLSINTTTGNWTVRVGTVSGNTFTPAFTESAPGGTIAAGDYLTWTLDTPVTLSANTTYAFDVDTSGSGFISANNAGDAFAGGTAFSSGGNGTPDDANLTLHNFDRVFHVNLRDNAIQNVGRLGVNNATGKIIGAAFETDVTSGPTGNPVNWQVDLLGQTEVQGLRGEWFSGTANRSKAAWDTFLAGNPAPTATFNGGPINYGDGQPYPAEAAALSKDNFSVRLTGEIFIPGGLSQVQFKDNNDDFAYLDIGGQTLINDDTWTNNNGAGNGGSPIAVFDASGIDPAGEWVPITFLHGEGSGGDSVGLFWDVNDLDNTFPTAQNQSANDNDAVPLAALRHFDISSRSPAPTSLASPFLNPPPSAWH